MQSYQPYFPFNQSYQPVQQNAYGNRMEQLQQFQQTFQPTMAQQQVTMANQFSTIGKIVESIDIVKATDIPMDGNMYYFPKADGTEIYTKQWMPNGKTRILSFKPILDEETVNSQTEDLKSFYGANKEILDSILDNLNTLNEKIDKISKSNTATKSKKESAADE